uniref:Uncharacterized protein n=1 Tax=Ditylenchus dipsaci TaxID=166011 RepID=A0A915DDN1_9BILA
MQPSGSSSTYVNGSMSVNENGIHRRLLPMHQPNGLLSNNHNKLEWIFSWRGEGKWHEENGIDARQSPSSIGPAVKQVGQANSKKRPHPAATSTLTGINMAALPASQQALVKKFRPIVPNNTSNSIELTEIVGF